MKLLDSLLSLIDKASDFNALLVQWMLETCAFILLPLLVYLVVFFSLDGNVERLFRLPEWMFAAIILHADMLRKLLHLYRNYRGFYLKMVRTLSFGILGIVISSIFLALSLIAQEKPAVLRVPEKAFYRWQMLVFALALLMSAFTSIWIAARKREGLLLRKMIPEAATPDDQEEA
jgi:hypothetical protein